MMIIFSVVCVVLSQRNISINSLLCVIVCVFYAGRLLWFVGNVRKHDL